MTPSTRPSSAGRAAARTAGPVAVAAIVVLVAAVAPAAAAPPASAQAPGPASTPGQATADALVAGSPSDADESAPTNDSEGPADADAPGRVAYPDGLVILGTSVEPRQPTPDRNFTVGADVAVHADSAESFVVRRVEVLNGTAADAERLNGRDLDERLRPGENRTYDVSVGVDEVGARTLAVEFRLVSTTGDPTTVVRPVTVDVRRSHPQVSVRTEPTLPGSSTNLTLDVSNGLEVPIRSVEVDVRPERVAVDDPRRVAPSVAAGDTRSFGFTVTGDTSGVERLAVDVAYTANGTRYEFDRTLRTRFTPPEASGNVTLTGIEVSEVADGERLRVRGTASNVGGGPVSGVVVSVLDGDGTDPARSNADYFVGRVAASDLSSFSVVADVTANGTVTVPLRVEYRVDGVRRAHVRTVTVTLDRPAPAESGGGLPLSSPALLGGGLVGVVVLGGVGWRWFGGDE